MDWLVNLAVLLVVGYFILVNTRKKKQSQSDDILPRYRTQRSKAEVEKESQEIIKRQLSRDVPSYQTIRSYKTYEKPFSGFLEYYLKYAKKDTTLTTNATSDNVQTLSENDLLRDLKLFLIYVCSFILN